MNIKRETWSDFEYFLINIGISIGLGCIWRFPFLLYDNGGAAFLIPYLFFLITLVFPLINLEIGVGQYYKKSLQEIYQKIDPKLVGNTYSILITICIMCSFYIFIMTYISIFIYCAIFKDLPFLLVPKEQVLQVSSDYFRYDILELKGINEGPGDLGGWNYQVLIFFLLNWIIVYFIIWKGVKTSSKVAKITVIFPYILFLILLLNVIRLPGFIEGIRFLFIPNLYELLKIKTWYYALDQCFFQYNLAVGGLMLFTTFRDRKQKIFQSSKILILTNFFTGLLSTFVVFGYLGYFSQLQGISINELSIEGIDLAFITYPAALSCLPFPRFWLIIFFINLYFIGIDSQFGACETACYILIDMKLKFNGKIIREEIIRLIFVIVIAFFGLIFATKKGFFFIKLVNIVILFIPMAFCSLILYYSFFIKGNFKKMMQKMQSLTGEKIPDWIFYFLKKVKFYYVFIIIGYFVQVPTYFFVFGYVQSIISAFIIFSIIGIFIFFYFKYQQDPSICCEKSFDILREIEMEDKLLHKQFLRKNLIIFY